MRKSGAVHREVVDGFMWVGGEPGVVGGLGEHAKNGFRVGCCQTLSLNKKEISLWISF